MFIGAIAVSGLALSHALEQKAEAEIAYRSQTIAETMNSVSNYTNTHVNPLLTPMVDTKNTFIPESIPSFAVREVFENLRKNEDYKDFLYKDANLNPTNLRDKADAFEIELIERFRREPELKNLSGFRDSYDEKLFYNARPFSIKNPTCLRCHSTPDIAPKSQIVSYGSENGFGWKLNEIVGTQVIYIPAKQVFDDAHRAFVLFISLFIIIFALVILLINYLLKRNVLQPLKPMAQLAQKISMNEISVEEAKQFDREKLTSIVQRHDELGQLGRVFQHMVHQISAREQQFKQQLHTLRIEVDEAKRAREVAEIAESKTFQKLQEEAKAIRNKRNAPN
ncbi:c-type heme family protein [Nostoc sp.]|uniref:c-type heme family protein n=1 Tax=Nostoc sp. TaxID=1180 RepID=UPI002FFAAE49